MQQIKYKSKQFREKIPDKTTWICINQDNTVNKVWREKNGDADKKHQALVV